MKSNAERITENVKEILQIILAIVIIIVVGGAMFYYTYIQYDTKIKIHETYSNAAENIGNK